MSHRLQRVAAAVLSGSLILLSPGLGCWSALAAAVTGSRAAAPAGGVPALGAIAAPAGLSSGGVAADLTLPAVGLESVPLAGEAPSARVEPALAAPAAPAPETAAIPESRTAPALAAAESAPRAAAPQELPVRAALQSIGEALAPSQGERAPANAYAASARAFDASALRASDGSADPVPADGGALGALRANELSPRTDSPAPGATAPEAPQASYGSSAAGHFLLASGLKKLELVLVGAGLFVLHGGALGITSTVALTAASVPLFALAGAFALTGLAYSLIGLRIAIAAWKQQKPAEEGAQAPPFWKRL
ncbi:MAG TPA: hypothetical protein VNI01_03390, partial [Elusimicrobiota bacterium]|nr:hypothetical protein [Elusimicrobiota bacterium]